MSEEHKSRAERAFDRHLARGKYPDGQTVKAEHRMGFIRGWNMAHRKYAAARRKRAPVDSGTGK